MRLVSFSVTNYRSITRAYKLPIGQLTVLIGPNNEGKSNILSALVTALQLLSNLGGIRIFKHRFRLPYSIKDIYDWPKDFPISLQASNPVGESFFQLEFELTKAEVEQFRTEVQSNLNGTLSIQVTMGSKEPTFKVLKRGPGGPALSKKAQEIAKFVAKRLDLKHIPAVRTAQSARRIVEAMVEREFAIAERDQAYKDALAKVAEIQAPVLEKISQSIQTTLKDFLPNVKKVKVSVSEEERYRALRSCEIIVDDGTPTELVRKGDGIQSLAALSLMRHSAEGADLSGRELILAIEEPESHLHPLAVHQLKKVFSEIVKKHQLIMTTHCPIFADRADMKSNIIVHRNKAIPAQSAKEIRDVLGVRVADNLQHAELILFVEGEEDRRSIRELLKCHSPFLKDALSNGYLAIDILMGASHLSYKLSQAREVPCLYHCFLDDDKSGQEAFEKAKDNGFIMVADITFSKCPGLREAEIEDLYNVNLYSDFLLKNYGVSVLSPKFKGKKKWSERLCNLFKSASKPWSERLEAEIKTNVTDLVIKNPVGALNPQKKHIFDNLVKDLENKLRAIL